MKKDKPTAPEIVRLNGRDVNTIFGVHAALSEIVTATEQMEKRFRAIPNGWRDAKLVIAKLRILCGELMRTVPPEKLLNLSIMARRMKFRLVLGPQAAKTDVKEVAMASDDLHILAHAAYEQCKFCPDWDNCDRCPLGRTLDRVWTHDRNGESWATVEVEPRPDETKE